VNMECSNLIFGLNSNFVQILNLFQLKICSTFKFVLMLLLNIISFGPK
jgi:hypothetical protein